ncbi:MAG: pyruvate, water dikinase regulatory protein [Bacteroidota bacterium]
MLQHIFIVSDGTGGTAQQSIKSALVQFKNIETEIHIRANVRTEEQILEVISEAFIYKGIIVHTLVSRELRHLILQQRRLHSISTIDLMGPLLAQLSHYFENAPSEKPGIYHIINKAYFQRIEAIEFALRHDDGQHVEELDNADIVLLGVSRTFKTPLSVYMAHKGWKVANIPIVLGIPIPKIVYQLPPERIFCLTNYPSRLAKLRQARDKHLGGLTGNYSSLPHVQKEIYYALRIYERKPKWTIINVMYKPIEEISSHILMHLRKY